MQSITFVDLFSGIGGTRIGFEQACQDKYEPICIFSCDIKKHAIKMYNRYFQENNTQKDITAVKINEIPKCDVLFAGFPCQPFSTAGLKLGFKDENRGNLFGEVLKFITFGQPKFFILENVDGITTHNKGKTLETIIQAIQNINYAVYVKTFDAADFGLAQKRKRTFFIGIKSNKNIQLDFENIQKNNNVFLKDIVDYDDNISDLPTYFVKAISKLTVDLEGKSFKDKRGGVNNIHSWDLQMYGSVTSTEKALLNSILLERRKKKWAIEKNMKWMDGIPLTLDDIASFTTNLSKDNIHVMLERLTNLGYLVKEKPKNWDESSGKRIVSQNLTEGYNINKGKLSFPLSKILRLDEKTPTLTATDCSKLGIKINSIIRRLNVLEIKRLCGFPETFDTTGFTKNQIYDVFGNMICPPVIMAISKVLLDNYANL